MSRSEYHWLEGQYDRVPALLADLVHRRVAVIATPGFTPASLAAKAATATIPVVFGVGDDPVKLGLVATLNRPGGNVTGINFFVHEIVSKRLPLLRELVPAAARIAVLINPGNAEAAEATLKETRDAASALGLQTAGEIDAAFAVVGRERADALCVGGDSFFFSRRGQFATLAARERLPTTYALREFAEAGGLMSYGTNLADMFRQVGIYAGSIVNGAKPADLPVLQSTKFEVSRVDSAMARRAISPSAKAGKACAERGLAGLCSGSAGGAGRGSERRSCSWPARSLERATTWTAAGSPMCACLEP
jgi:ABC-type uncharacterized transport system substrate-binding protein